MRGRTIAWAAAAAAAATALVFALRPAQRASIWLEDTGLPPTAAARRGLVPCDDERRPLGLVIVDFEIDPARDAPLDLAVLPVDRWWSEPLRDLGVLRSAPTWYRGPVPGASRETEGRTWGRFDLDPARR